MLNTVRLEQDMRVLEKNTGQNKVKKWFQVLVILMRVLFGFGWLLAGITKITEKSWFSQPGVFLTNYLVDTCEKPNVPEFYKYFIDQIVLHHVMLFNYVIPVTQIIVGFLLIVGLLIVPSIIVCLFMHINFILSGNMNVTSLVLYTSAFALLLSGQSAYALSFDRYFQLENRLPWKNTFTKKSIHVIKKASFQHERHP